MSDDDLSKKFDLVTVPNNAVMIDDTPKLTHEIITTTSEAAQDFSQARKAMSDAIKVGSNAIENLGDIAQQAQLPEHYSAMASMLTAMSTAASTMMKLHKQSEELAAKIANDKPEVHNHLHIPPMSTAQFAQTLKMITGKE